MSEQLQCSCQLKSFMFSFYISAAAFHSVLYAMAFFGSIPFFFLSLFEIIHNA